MDVFEDVLRQVELLMIDWRLATSRARFLARTTIISVSFVAARTKTRPTKLSTGNLRIFDPDLLPPP